MPSSPQRNRRVVLPKQYFQAMEVHRLTDFALVDSWETCVLIFFLSRARLLRAFHPYSGIWQERTLVRYSCATPIQWKLTSLFSSAIIEDINAMCNAGLASMAYF